MKQLIEQLTELGFHEATADGKKVAKADASTEWAHVQAKDDATTVFQKGSKKVIFNHVPSGATAQRQITFKDGERVLSFTNSGDLPSKEFVESFATDKEVAEEAKKEEPKGRGK
jgi:hypothetical protein